MKLDRRVAIITGAAAGIGEAAARLFAKEGARLILVDLDEERLARLTEELEAASTIVLDIPADVSVSSTAESVVARTTNQFGHIDVLFNNAGIVLGGTLVECTEEEWDRTMAVNLKSMYYLCRAVVPVMQRQGAGAIVNMSSIAGAAGVVQRGAYTVSKAGVIGLTKSLAADYVKDGIRVNCICPATVDTPSLQRRIATAPDPQQARRAFVARQPMGRIGTPEEIAALALYLACDDSRYMTGQAIVIDGGMKV